LVWLHGFTQTKHSSYRFRSILAGSYEVLTIDLPGHGENAGQSASLEDTADMLAEALPRDPFILAGYSLGGRVALHVALRHPDRLAHLVLLSATPGIANDEERRARRERDEELADRIEIIGTDAFLDEWLAQPMFQSIPADPRERGARSHDARGLADSLRYAGTGTQDDLVEALRQLATPTLILAGANDEKFAHEATRLGEAIARSTRRLVPDAGHAAHLEQPGSVATLVATL
jgi:2-succinyl-6-hydroxy-2,4-cyclohexadiene-1-carboxylate synthase